MKGTHVIALGKLGAMQPQLRYNPMPGNRTATPGQFQALPRPVLQNGPSALGRVVEFTSLGNLGKVSRMLGADLPVEDQAMNDLQQAAAGMQSNEDPYAIGAGQQAGQTAFAGYIDAARAWSRISWYVAPIGAGFSAYHGYKRHRGSIGWAITWAFFGGLFPIVTPAIGMAQGWGKPKR